MKDIKFYIDNSNVLPNIKTKLDFFKVLKTYTEEKVVGSPFSDENKSNNQLMFDLSMLAIDLISDSDINELEDFYNNLP